MGTRSYVWDPIGESVHSSTLPQPTLQHPKQEVASRGPPPKPAPVRPPLRIHTEDIYIQFKDRHGPNWHTFRNNDTGIIHGRLYDSQMFVMHVMPDTDGWKQGIRHGWEILQVALPGQDKCWHPSELRLGQLNYYFFENHRSLGQHIDAFSPTDQTIRDLQHIDDDDERYVHPPNPTSITIESLGYGDEPLDIRYPKGQPPILVPPLQGNPTASSSNVPGPLPTAPPPPSRRSSSPPPVKATPPKGAPPDVHVFLEAPGLPTPKAPGPKPPPEQFQPPRHWQPPPPADPPPDTSSDETDDGERDLCAGGVSLAWSPCLDRCSWCTKSGPQTLQSAWRCTCQRSWQ